MAGSMGRIAAVMRKEAFHILRDPQTLFIVICMPMVMMFLFGYALTTDVRDAAVAVEDPSGCVESGAVIRSLDASTLFNVAAVEHVISDPREYFRMNRVKAIVRIPTDFAVDVRRTGRSATIQVLIDGSDPNIGTIIRNAAETAILDPLLRALSIEKPEPVHVHQSVLYNPQQRSAVYFVPGLMVLILSTMSALLTSVALVREKELGTFSQLVVTPLRSFEIIIGKIVPYMMLAAVDGTLVLLMGRVLFGVRVNGSILLLAAASVLYILVMLSFGLLISSVTSRQLHAMFAAILITLLPTVILTGFVFPVSSMPIFLQCISAIIPATYFLRIVRAIILKGVGIDMLWQPMAILSVQGLLLIRAAIKKFRMTA